MEGDYISNNSTQFRPEFQSTPSAWRETIIRYCLPCCRSYFNPLPPHGGRPPVPAAGTLAQRISIHSLRMEGDILNLISDLQKYLFQSTPSAWRETKSTWSEMKFKGNFNPLPPHGGRLSETYAMMQAEIISIHSLRMEGDIINRLDIIGKGISIHSLRMEGDKSENCHHHRPEISIHSLRMEGDLDRWIF